MTTVIDRKKLAGTGVSEAHAKSLLDTIDDSILQGNSTETAAVETKDTAEFGLKGFVNGANNPDTTMLFDDASRTLTITPIGDSFSYWVDGVKYTKTEAQTVIISDDEGPHFAYFSGENLVSTQIFNPAIISKKTISSIIIWDKANSKRVGYAEERHGRVMGGETHLSMHLYPGTMFVHGCDLGNNAAPSGAPADDTTSKVYIAAGSVRDEDITITSVNSATPSNRWEQILGSNLTSDAAKLPVIYLDGATGFWRKWDNDSDRFAFMHNGGNTPPYFNEFSGGNWQLSPCPNRDFVVYYVCMWNDYDYPVFLMMGQNFYERLSDAEAATASSIDWGVYDPAELIVLHKMIFEHRTIYTNATHRCTLRSVESYNVAGTSKVALINANQNHASLQNLTYEASAHTGFAPSMYFSVVDPTADNDEVDTADLGKTFMDGDFWRNSTGDKLFFCDDSTATSAVWRQITLT